MAVGKHDLLIHKHERVILHTFTHDLVPPTASDVHNKALGFAEMLKFPTADVLSTARARWVVLAQPVIDGALHRQPRNLKRCHFDAVLRSLNAHVVLELALHAARRAFLQLPPTCDIEVNLRFRARQDSMQEIVRIVVLPACEIMKCVMGQHRGER